MPIFLILNHLRKRAFLYLTLVLIVIVTFQQLRISNLKLQVKIRDNELITIENKAKEYSKKLLKAQDQYKESIKKSKSNSQRILNSHVSDDCDASIKWAIQQSQYFY